MPAAAIFETTMPFYEIALQRYARFRPRTVGMRGYDRTLSPDYYLPFQKPRYVELNAARIEEQQRQGKTVRLAPPEEGMKGAKGGKGGAHGAGLRSSFVKVLRLMCWPMPSSGGGPGRPDYTAEPDEETKHHYKYG